MEDFSFTYANEDNIGKTTYVVKSQQHIELPEWLANKILKQLAYQVYYSRFGDPGAYGTEVIKIKKEICEK